MKKIVSALLALSMVFGVATVTKAEEVVPETGLTQAQKEARQNYLPIHLEKMTQLTDLRAQTKTAEENNNNIAKQIKEKVKSSEQNKDAIAKLKEVAAKNKDLVAQAKNLHNQRVELQKQFKDAVKARDTAAANTAKEKILALNSQIEGIRQQIKANSDAVKAQKDQLKTLRDSLKAKKEQLKPIEQQVKDLRQKISGEEQAKNQLWQTYKSNIQAKDYTTAANTLQSILDAKAKILADIKARGESLANILSTVSK